MHSRLKYNTQRKCFNKPNWAKKRRILPHSDMSKSTFGHEYLSALNSYFKQPEDIKKQA